MTVLVYKYWIYIKHVQSLLQCWYIGGKKDSATYILGTMAKPVTWSMPAIKVCEKLKEKDAQICDLKYGRVISVTLFTNSI